MAGGSNRVVKTLRQLQQSFVMVWKRSRYGKKLKNVKSRYLPDGIWVIKLFLAFRSLRLTRLPNSGGMLLSILQLMSKSISRVKLPNKNILYGKYCYSKTPINLSLIYRHPELPGVYAFPRGAQ